MGRVNVQKALLEFFRGSVTKYSDVKSDATVRPCPRARNAKYKYKSTSKQKYKNTKIHIYIQGVPKKCTNITKS